MSDLANRLENERWKMTKWETVNGRPVELNSAELTAILAALEDAERYRWLRDTPRGRSLSVSALEWNNVSWLCDAAIDKARRAGR